MVKTKIEWCDSSWNPVTGCYHDCPYCYARSIANRFGGCDAAPDGNAGQKIVELENRLKATKKSGKVLNAAYPYGFTPTLHKYRLGDPLKKGFGKTIFVCSTADLFGGWVPDEWIEKVFVACKAADNHRYLFLTKNPARYIDLWNKGLLPKEDNFWYGSTATDEDMPIFYSDELNTFCSMEPVLGPFNRKIDEDKALALTDWFILGAETGNRKDRVVPKREWIENVVKFAHDNGKPVFMKDSLVGIWGAKEDLITEFPWQD